MYRKIALISDIHGNMTAFQAVCDDLKKQKINEVWFLGDMFSPGPGALEQWKLFKSLEPSVCVRGNWDDLLVNGYKGRLSLENRVASSFLGWPNLSGCSLVRQSLMKSNIGLCISSLTSIISGSAAPIICRFIILVKSFIRRLPRQRLMKCLKIPMQTLLFMHTFIIRSCVIRLQNNLSSTRDRSENLFVTGLDFMMTWELNTAF